MQKFLTESEERYRALFESSPISMWENDFSEVKKYIDDLRRNGVEDFSEYLIKHPEVVSICASKVHTLDTNKATLELFECKDKETFLNNIKHIFVNESNSSLRDAFISMAEGKRFSGKTVQRTFNNEIIDCEVRQAIVPGYEDSWGKVLSTITDITQSNRMQESLAESEKRYRALFESSPISMWEDDFSEVKNYLDGLRLKGIEDFNAFFNKHPREVKKCSGLVKIIDVNNTTLEMMKCKDKETFLKKLDYIFIDKTSNALRDCFVSFAGGSRSFETGTVHRRFDNEYIDCEVSLTIVPGYENTWARVISALTDVTQRNMMERALKESEKKFRNLFENANDAIAYLSTSGEIIEVNHAAADMFGGTIDELKGKHFTDLGFFTAENMPKFVSMLSAIMKGARGPYSVNLVNRNGRQMSLESSAALMKSGHKITGILIVTRDVTERTKLEEERQQTARLESIGTLAGGIAHDFNNLLTGIMGNIGLAKMNEQPGGETYEMLEEAEKASIRAKNLTQQLLTFSRGGLPIKKPISIRKILEESTEFALRGSNVKPRFSISDDLWIVDADEGQIVQVIANLVINAHDSMPDGGILEVNACNAIVKKDVNLPLKPGKYVEVTVKDKGVGIKEEHLKRIFEPYFTTKQKGSGLGLATVYAIIKKHDGHISVESTLGSGSTFRFYLPALSTKVAQKTEVAKPVAISTTGGRILVMDDNELIRELVPRMLTMNGYEVDTAADGKEALIKYKKALSGGKKFDVVIMDLTIPGGMGGKEAIKKIKKIDPKVKAIASSGYANDPIMANYSKYGFSAIVAKPYSAQEMQQVLYNVLNKK
jgi:PAS domain S-box-containing protein